MVGVRVVGVGVRGGGCEGWWVCGVVGVWGGGCEGGGCGCEGWWV